jgi:16S rRNA processing protein RimM
MSDRQGTDGNPLESGSSNTDEPVYLLVGKLHKPHGVRGEMRMSVWTDFPERLEPGKTLYLGGETIPRVISSARWHNEVLLITFEGITDRDVVGAFRNYEVFVDADELPDLEEGEIYLHELIGMHVYLEGEQDALGELTGVMETGANDVYIITKEDGSEVLIPAIDDVILSIDVEENEIEIRPLPGLLDG